MSDGGSRVRPQLAAAGPRAAGREAEYELLLEMILEGSLLHYGRPRVVATDDRDLALLLGDQLYALGLSRLAELGDLEAVAELADVISLLSQAQHVGSRARRADLGRGRGRDRLGRERRPRGREGAARSATQSGALVDCCDRAADRAEAS